MICCRAVPVEQEQAARNNAGIQRKTLRFMIASYPIEGLPALGALINSKKIEIF
jgi:hypothetical protein